MNQDEFLARISGAMKTGGQSDLDPEVQNFLKQQVQNHQSAGANMQVAPPKPDPEAAANAQIAAKTPALQVNPRAAALQQMAQPAPQESPEEKERQENERLMQMEYYAQKAGLK